MRVLLLVVVLSFCSCAWSAEQHEIRPEKPKQQTQTGKAGTDKNPITVKILPSQDAEANALKEEEYRKEKSAQDEKLVDATVWLFRVTSALAFFTLGLWIATVKLASDAKKSSERQAAEMEKSLAIAKESADAAKKAAEVSEIALLKVERPYLLVSVSDFNIGNRTDDNDGSLYYPVIRYSVSNHGKLPAIIDGVCAEIIHAPDERLNAPISVDDTDPLLMDRVIESNGWRQDLKFTGSTIDAKIVNSSTLTDHEIFFWIIIRYHGPFTNGHETSGCWRVSFKFRDKLTLIQYGHDKYNYTN